MSITLLMDWRHNRRQACDDLRYYYRQRELDVDRVGFYLEGSVPPDVDYVKNLLALNLDDFADHPRYRPTILINELKGTHSYSVVLQLTKAAANRISAELIEYFAGRSNQLAVMQAGVLIAMPEACRLAHGRLIPQDQIETHIEHINRKPARPLGNVTIAAENTLNRSL